MWICRLSATQDALLSKTKVPIGREVYSSLPTLPIGVSDALCTVNSNLISIEFMSDHAVS